MSYLVLVQCTYIITVNAGVSIIGGANLVGQMTAGYSTSSTAFSQNINLAINYSGLTGNTSNQWALNSSNIISVSSTTTYHLQIQCSSQGYNILKVLVHLEQSESASEELWSFIPTPSEIGLFLRVPWLPTIKLNYFAILFLKVYIQWKIIYI
jgi:hypothetical protein